MTAEVDVDEAGVVTHHLVHVQPADLARWGQGRSPEELVRRSFEFLLERESKESILLEFELSVIPRYFPDFDRVMTGGA
ncbi:MAG TPA: hypothetical protein VET65_14155 [Candidatus Limnocylindrales bacterium]|nr:hypothetical protein [Candidatus Limnocylindrales bacterium]